jgi:uncharacterized repeat protein (TIGR01451 family)
MQYIWTLLKQQIPMKALLGSTLIVLLLLVPKAYLFAQQSENTISYKVTYNLSDEKYTVWIVPEYNVPNNNNSGQNELGATAQVTLAVPKDFIISNVTDVVGLWEKSPLKLGPGQPNQGWSNYSLDPDTNYYVISKSASETDYGTFTSGVDIPLFTFESNDCFGPLRIIEPDEPFIAAADDNFSLNVANSFYSRSGAPQGGNQVPLEQFRAIAGTAAICTQGTDTIDISVVKLVDQSTADLNDEVTFNIVVRNNGLVNATNIVIKDVLPDGLQYVSGAELIQNGAYFWMISTLLPNEAQTLSIRAKVVARGRATNTASLESVDQDDTDSTNNVSQVCVSAPVALCQGKTLELSVPSSSTNVSWYKDSVLFGSGNTISVSESGSYTNKAPNDACPTNNCCPIVVITETCCNPETCIPIIIKKVR